ncbi:MAG: methionine--tRNA ligase [Nitrospinota bacterium]
MNRPKKFYVTTPIYYVNDVPHLGHVYTTVAADVLARYRRMEGEELFFLTGTDEHGQKAEQAAKQSGVSVREHVDTHSKVFQNIWKEMELSNSDFIRTTEERHVKVVQTALQKLYDADEIYTDSYEGWYCVPDERFWTEKDLDKGNCPECGRPVERIKEKNYFFKMGKYQTFLIDHIKNNEDFILPKTRRNEVLGFLEKPLEDLCISRPKSRMSWGIELPFDSDYVCYVWFDALLNYVTAPGLYSDDERFNSVWPADVHIIGKDILTTHSVYWPTMLKAMGLPMPKRIFAHGWWTIDGKKMSKSLGNVFDPLKVAHALGIDPFRYFLMREVPFGQDGDFSGDSLVNRVNVDLANNLGNLVSRALTMIKKYRGGKVPSPHSGPELAKLKSVAEKTMADYRAFMERPFFNRALEEMISLSDEVNRFIVTSQPWSLAKDESKSDLLDDVLYGVAESLRLMGKMILPFMPVKGAQLLEQLGLKDNGFGTDDWGGLRPGSEVKSGEPLFPRIDEKKEKEIKSLLMLKSETATQESGDTVSIDDFKKLDLRTAVIIAAEPVPKAKKLLKLQVDMGTEKRQVVAGIAEHYKPEEIIGRQVIIVANLKPAKIMGVESKGMLLAASGEGKLLLTGPWDESGPGWKVS